MQTTGPKSRGLIAIGLSVLIGFSPFLAAGANPLPASRTPGGRGSWDGLVGVPGGIPNRTTIFATISAGSSLATVQNAIDRCPSGQVVLLAAGTHNWAGTDLNGTGGTLNLRRNDVTLRGAGAGRTVIMGSIQVGDWAPWWNMMSNPTSGNHVAWTGGLAQGSTQITIDSAAGFAVGQLILLDQLNDPDTGLAGYEFGVTPGAYISVAYPKDGRDRAQHQMTRIVAINGNVMTIADPVYMPNYNATYKPEVWRFVQQPTVGVGVEDLSVEGNNAFRFSCSYGSWLTRCTVKQSLGSQQALGFINMQWSARCTLKGNLVEPIEARANTHGHYGIEPRVCSGMLIEDNLTNFVNVGIQISGCSGSVFAYNHVANSQSASAYFAAAFLNHGGWPNMCLIEGNIAPVFTLDNTDSPSGYNTVHRNWLGGKAQLGTPTKNITALTVNARNRHCSAIGNVLGSDGETYAALENASSNDKGIYAIGYEGPVERGGYDPKTPATLIRAYNWNQYTRAVISDGYTASDIPASYYLPSKPAWFGSLAWPAIDPDQHAASRNSVRIPAGYRFVNGANPPAGPLIPVINSKPSATGINGTPFTYQIVGTNSPTTYGATPLPDGLNLNSSTGIISGTPTAVSSTSIRISATNAQGTGSTTLELLVRPASPGQVRTSAQ